MQPKGNNTYRTSQSILLKIYDFSMYEKLQVGLLKIGINNFSSLFSSTEITEIKERAISSLIDDAKIEAEIYARNLGLQVGEIKEIETSTGRVDAGQTNLFSCSTKYRLFTFGNSSIV